MKDVTIYDVARALGISPSTVSRGLKDHPHIQDDTKKRIVETAKLMGYQRNKFASNLRQRKTHTLGVVVPRLDSYFMATAIAGIEKITNKSGYSIIITSSQESGEKEVEGTSTLFNISVDGIIVSLASDSQSLDHFRHFFDRNIPVVFFDRVFECSGCASIIIDNYRAGYEVVSHLIQQGCKRIVHLGGNMQRNVYSERFRGYKMALSDNGIKFNPDLLMISDLNESAGQAAAAKIVKMKNRPDGLFCSNDTSAVAAIISFQKLGIAVPDDIAVAGFNNEPASVIINPGLTTVNYPALEIGEVAATTMINKLNSIEVPSLSTIILEHKLIIRNSSQRIKI